MNVAAGGQAIVGTVTHRSHEGAFPENQDQPYGTEHERTREPAADAPVRSQEAGWPTLSEAESQGSQSVSAARGAQGSGAPKGEANGRYSHGLLTAEAIEERSALSAILGRSVK